MNHHNHHKPSGTRGMLLAGSLLLLLLIAVGGTVAYLVATPDDPLENLFSPAKVSCAIVENNGNPIEGAVVEVSKKENVKIQNTGDVKAYIRAAIVINWKDASGNVLATAPGEGDYALTLDLTNGWSEGSDGFYYYADAVDPDEMTAVLLTSCAPIDGKTPEGYGLSVEILASAIQTAPTQVVEDQWDVTVTDGKISKGGSGT